MDHQADTKEGARPFEVSHRMVFSIAVPMTVAFLTTPLLGLVDMAVVGRLGQPALIGGLAVSTILFDLVFATFNFLRAATTGLVAQAYGRGDEEEQRLVFWRSLTIAVLCGLLVILAGPVLLWVGLWFMSPGAEVATAATTYLSIRVISSPAALANYAILGFVLGRGRAGIGLLLQTLINGTNIVLSVWFGLWLGWGLSGVAWGTVCAEIAGCLAGLAIILPGFRAAGRLSLARIFDRGAVRRLMALNADIMIRTLALLLAFAWFTRAGAQLGALPLAVNAVLMNIFMLAAYYLDGLATAAEQIAGRAVGANYRPAFVRAVRLTTLWSFILSGFTTAFFFGFGNQLIALMTTAENVRSLASVYLPWAAVAALTGVLAFLMDGVFIGATWSRDMRNAMLLSLAIFVVATEALSALFGNHGLWAALNLFLLARGLSLLWLLPSRIDRTFAGAQAGIGRAA
jgi:putative efflux protein, MATE family